MPSRSRAVPRVLSYFTIVSPQTYPISLLFLFPAHRMYCPCTFLQVTNLCSSECKVASVMARKVVLVDRAGDKIDNPLRTSWIPIVLNDPLLFQATVSFSAANMDIYYRRKRQRQSLRMKAQTISMIKEKLQCGDNFPSDSIIGVVALLSAIEVSRSSGSMAKVRRYWRRPYYMD